MTPERLAHGLYAREVEYAGIKATPWEGLHESHRRKWYVLAEAALTALRGPRTGEELYEAFGAAAKEELGCEYQRPSWTELAEWWRAVHHQVAATFATPKSPPCPEGWAEGWIIYSGEPAPPRRWANIDPHGGQFLPDTEDGRIASHILAGWRPSATPKPPEGWPKGWSTKGVMRTGPGGTIALKMGQPNIWYLDVTPDGATSIKEVWRIAGLVAHTLANGAPVQPASTVNHDAEIERLKTALRIAEAGNRGREDTIKGLERERDEARAAEADAQQRRQRVKAIAMDLAGELADVRLAELTGRIEGADE